VALLRAALRGGATAAGAVCGEWLVGVALAAPASAPLEDVDQLLALGVAPDWRRGGLAASLLQALAEDPGRQGRAMVGQHTAAERDPYEPLPRSVRREIADRLFRSAGFTALAVASTVAAADADAIAAAHLALGTPAGMRSRIEDWLAAR
jgi:GNAT superfamily N-acetyltransferase